jgi:choline-glycine betaine transporter
MDHLLYTIFLIWRMDGRRFLSLWKMTLRSRICILTLRILLHVATTLRICVLLLIATTLRILLHVATTLRLPLHLACTLRALLMFLLIVGIRRGSTGTGNMRTVMNQVMLLLLLRGGGGLHGLHGITGNRSSSGPHGSSFALTEGVK